MARYAGGWHSTGQNPNPRIAPQCAPINRDAQYRDEFARVVRPGSGSVCPGVPNRSAENRASGGLSAACAGP
jgi:hypothetical protein